jgi:hypothetical protein
MFVLVMKELVVNRAGEILNWFCVCVCERRGGGRETCLSAPALLQQDSQRTLNRQ